MADRVRTFAMKDFSCIDYQRDGIVLQGEAGQIKIATAADAKVVIRCLHHYLSDLGIEIEIVNGHLLFRESATC